MRRRLDDLEVELAPATLLGRRCRAARVALLAPLLTFLPTRLPDRGRAHLDPDGADDAQEEEEDQRDDPPLHDVQDRVQVLRGDEHRPRIRCGHDISKMSFVDPTLTSSPLARSCSRTGVPFTLVPLVDPRSVTKTPSPLRRSSAWRRPTLA